MSKAARDDTVRASIGRGGRDGKAPRRSSTSQDLQDHRDDHADGHETRGDGHEVPDDALESDRERAQAEHGDPQTEAREPRRNFGALAAGEAPKHASGHEGHDAEPKFHGAYVARHEAPGVRRLVLSR